MKKCSRCKKFVLLPDYVAGNPVCKQCAEFLTEIQNRSVERKERLALSICEECLVEAEILHTLLGRRYCDNCISDARSKRRKRLNQSKIEDQSKKATKSQTSPKEAKLRNTSLQKIRETILSEGLAAFEGKLFPIRLKRNERVYFASGNRTKGAFHYSLIVTSQRLFYLEQKSPIFQQKRIKEKFPIVAGIKAQNLSSVIAIDSASKKIKGGWPIILHLDSGKNISISLTTLNTAHTLYIILAELIDRLNDPIDENAFRPVRERISDEIKVAVWRRDGGQCVRCQSRENLEYDHIIPVSKGGANTVRNIELLCQSCNRTKSNKIM